MRAHVWFPGWLVRCHLSSRRILSRAVGCQSAVVTPCFCPFWFKALRKEPRPRLAESSKVQSLHTGPLQVRLMSTVRPIRFLRCGTASSKSQSNKQMGTAPNFAFFTAQICRIATSLCGWGMMGLGRSWCTGLLAPLGQNRLVQVFVGFGWRASPAQRPGEAFCQPAHLDFDALPVRAWAELAWWKER